MTTTLTNKQIIDLGRLTKTIREVADRKDFIRESIDDDETDGKLVITDLDHEEKFYADIVELLFDYGMTKYGDKFDKAVKLPK